MKEINAERNPVIYTTAGGIEIHKTELVQFGEPAFQYNRAVKCNVLAVKETAVSFMILTQDSELPHLISLVRYTADFENFEDATGPWHRPSSVCLNTIERSYVQIRERFGFSDTKVQRPDVKITYFDQDYFIVYRGKEIYDIVKVEKPGYGESFGYDTKGNTYIFRTNFSREEKKCRKAIQTYTGAGEFGIAKTAYGFYEEEGFSFLLPECEGFYVSGDVDMNQFMEHYNSL